jgi:hypothetical protein
MRFRFSFHRHHHFFQRKAMLPWQAQEDAVVADLDDVAAKDQQSTADAAAAQVAADTATQSKAAADASRAHLVTDVKAYYDASAAATGVKPFTVSCRRP